MKFSKCGSGGFRKASTHPTNTTDNGPMRETFTFHTAGQLLFGRNAVRQTGDIVRPIARPSAVFIVTDQSPLTGGHFGEGTRIARRDDGRSLRRRRTGAVARRWFCGVSSRRKRFGPISCSASAAAATWTRPSWRPSLLTHGGSPRDYVGEEKVPGPVLPLVCVPTTAGTGSEVSAAAVFTDTENHMKVSMPQQFHCAPRRRSSIRC